MNLADEAVYLCTHGAEHAWFRAKWISDLARIHTSEKIDWQAAENEARRWNHERELQAGLLLLKEVYGLPLPELVGNPWGNFPKFILKEQLRCLAVPDEFGTRSALTQLWDQIRKARHDRLVRPHTSWRQSFAVLSYRKEDFVDFPLPEGLFWAYAPLRPLLWVWRKVRRVGMKQIESS
jgi:hypothetical protein